MPLNHLLFYSFGYLQLNLSSLKQMMLVLVDYHKDEAFSDAQFTISVNTFLLNLTDYLLIKANAACWISSLNIKTKFILSEMSLMDDDLVVNQTSSNAFTMISCILDTSDLREKMLRYLAL